MILKNSIIYFAYLPSFLHFEALAPSPLAIFLSIIYICILCYVYLDRDWMNVGEKVLLE